MKRIIAVLLLWVMLLSLAACGSPPEEGVVPMDDSEITGSVVPKAVSALKGRWKDIYSESGKKYGTETDGYFEIKNTRVFTIRETDVEEFRDVAYIVEFMLFTDYYGLAPYYRNVTGLDSSVVVYRSGKMEVRELLNQYIAKYYVGNYSQLSFIESIQDYGDRFDCTEHLN